MKDRLGSAYATTNATGNVVGEMRYYAFGETRLSTGTMFTDRLYTGQRQIAELGIYHYNARFYSPKLGRFLSADTLMSGFANPQNLNRFAYVANNPLRYTDPTGHMLMADTEGGGGSYTTSPIADYCATHPSVCSGGSGGSDDGDGGSDGGGGIGVGVFTEQQLNDFGIDCGGNVDQVACDVYTQGSAIAMASINVDFEGNSSIGNLIADAACMIIYQGCVQEGQSFGGAFAYSSYLGSNGTNWNRYVVTDSGSMEPLFLANWSVASYNGSLVAKETFPLQGGQLGYASVFLQPDVVDREIVWKSVAFSYGIDPNFSVGITLSDPLITFRTFQNGYENFFRTEGTLTLFGQRLGQVSVNGYFP